MHGQSKGLLTSILVLCGVLWLMLIGVVVVMVVRNADAARQAVITLLTPDEQVKPAEPPPQQAAMPPLAAGIRLGPLLEAVDGDWARWFAADAYPAEAIARAEQGRTVLAVKVTTDGRPRECAAIVSSGSPSLDARTCKILKEHGHFTVARDSNGAPIEIWMRGPAVRWALP